MVDDLTQLKRALANTDQVTRLPGFYRGPTVPASSQGYVDVGGGRIPADFTGFQPALNAPVWVLIINGTATILGTSTPTPGTGTIVSSSGGLASVTTAFGTLTGVPFDTRLTLTAGQVVKMSWPDGPYIDSVKSTQPLDPSVPVAPGGGSKTQSQTFLARDSASFQSGRWWTNDVWYGTNNLPGAWFYGSKIKDTIPSSATIVSVEIYLHVTQAYGSAPQIGRHNFGSRPGSGFSITSKQTLSGIGAGYRGFVSLNTSLGDFLKANTGGVGTDGAGLAVFAGTQRDGQSGALRIKWR